jgi:hypothetical protein
MTQEVPYNMVKKIEDIEIRQYPEVIFAVVEDNTDDSGFGLLFQYISGENKTRKKIAMTAPVIIRKNYMAFALPSSYTNETVPIPNNPVVKIEIRPEKTMAILRFSHRSVEKRVQKNMQQLITTLKNHSMHMKGEPVLMRYNSPFTPGFLRRNEVAIEINDLK